MTSSNLSGKPSAITNEQALDDLHDIADGFFALHNRDIVQRMDDPVVLYCQRRNAASFAGIRADAIALPPDSAMCRRYFVWRGSEKHVLLSGNTRRTGGCRGQHLGDPQR